MLTTWTRLVRATNFKHLHNRNSSKVYENLPQKSLWKRFLDSQPAFFDFLNALSDHLSYLFALLVLKFHSELFRDLCFASRSLSQQIFFHISKISKPRNFDFWIRNLFVSDSSCDSSAEIFAIFAFNSSRRFSSLIWESFLIAFLGPESFNSSETSWFFLFLGLKFYKRFEKMVEVLKSTECFQNLLPVIPEIKMGPTPALWPPTHFWTHLLPAIIWKSQFLLSFIFILFLRQKFLLSKFQVNETPGKWDCFRLSTENVLDR